MEAGALAELSLAAEGAFDSVEGAFDSVEGALEPATLPESEPVPDEASEAGAELLEA